MNRDIVRQVAVVVAVIATIVVNVLANALPINGLTTAEISDRFEVFFVPAGYVFAIWGLISIALLAFAAFQALPSQRANPRLRRVGYWFVLGSAANIAWIFLWHYEQFALTVAAMLLLLVSLIVVYLGLGVGRAAVTVGERWFVHLPFSIYLGWITVATIANVTALLAYLNWDGFGIAPEVWTALVLAVAVVIAALMALTRADVAYLLVLVWAFVGIAVKHGDTAAVAVSALVAAGLAVAFAVMSALRVRRGGSGAATLRAA